MTEAGTAEVGRRTETEEYEDAPVQKTVSGVTLRLAAVLALNAITWTLKYGVGAGYDPQSVLFLVVNGAIIVIGGYAIVLRAFRSAFMMGRLTSDFLMAIVIVGAVSIGMWMEAAAVVLISAIAEAAERAVGGGLAPTGLGSAPARVVVRRGDETAETTTDRLAAGDVVVVDQGSTVPVDGVIASGHARVSEAALTGESTFNEKSPGDRVYAGSIVHDAPLDVVVERVGEETVLMRSARLAEKAIRQRTPTDILVDRVTGVIVPVIMALGLFTFLFSVLALRLERSGALLNALTIMVVASPVALALASPTAIWAGIRRASRQGILFRTGSALERLASARILVIDKTGTLTDARPQVAGIKVFGERSEREILETAALVEQRSSHPLAKAIMQRAASQGVKAQEPDKFMEFEGGGACAIIGGRRVKVGGVWLMEDGRDMPEEVMSWISETEGRGYTCTLVADNESIVGGIFFEDRIRPEARKVLDALRKRGFRRFVMLTGDNPNVAYRVSKDLGIDEYVASCMPDTKLEKLKTIQRWQTTAMIGDGVNDAPALAEADIGIAMGAGSRMAVESAEVTLLRNDLTGLLSAVSASRRVRATTALNVLFALAVNVSLVAMAGMGAISLITGAFVQQVAAVVIAAHSSSLLIRKV